MIFKINIFILLTLCFLSACAKTTDTPGVNNPTVSQFTAFDFRGNIFIKDKDGKVIPQFTPGTIQMEVGDMELGRTMVYKEFGWDEKTGAPSRAGLEAVGLKDVADDLAARGLLPA
jgi:hypothetical protein